MKSCDNCYWQLRGVGVHCSYSNKKPIENVCEKHSYPCESCDYDRVEYSYEGKRLCFDCLLNELEIESYTITHYTCKGEYIADEDDIGQVISEWNKDIEIIKD